MTGTVVAAASAVAVPPVAAPTTASTTTAPSAAPPAATASAAAPAAPSTTAAPSAAPPAAPAAIELVDYSFRYESAPTPVVRNCTFRLEYGEFVVLGGDSGAGKSTLLASIIGSIPHLVSGERSGRILIDGVDVDAANGRICDRARVMGSVLQDADAQIVHAKVEDEIAFGCENRAMAATDIEQRIDEACRMMQLERSWATATLSGGQKQRLITATTLAMGQRILVLDEPLANLDRAGATLLMRTLKDLCRRGYAVLLVEHRLDHVLPYADRLLWLQDGQCQLREVAASSSIITDNSRPRQRSQKGSDAPVLELRQVAYEVRGRNILKNIDLSVGKGERLVILGENGCGKTTLLRLLARLQRPSAGHLLREGKPLPAARARARWFDEVGYVFQNPGYQLFMPQVQKEVEYRCASNELARSFLKRFGLEELAARHPHSLSEGQKRVLSIAVILARKPKVVLLDEPTVGQDFAALERLVAILNELCAEQGTSIVTVTHDQRCAAALADRVILIQNGHITHEGDPTLAHNYFQN